MKFFPYLTALLFTIASLSWSCNSDKLEPIVVSVECETVTYDNSVKAIIDKNCAYSGCHLTGDFPPGNFTSYAGMQPFLSDALFKKFVLDLREDEELGMPPYYVPDGKPEDLTADELETITCWVNNDYLEN